MKRIVVLSGVLVALGVLAVSMWPTTSNEHVVAGAPETEPTPGSTLATRPSVIQPAPADTTAAPSTSPTDLGAAGTASSGATSTLAVTGGSTTPPPRAAEVASQPPTDAVVDVPTPEPAAEEAVTPEDAYTGSCGGDLPPCWVRDRESRGDYQAVNPRGCGGRGCFGAWQFDPRTWNNFMGYADPRDAPPLVQDAKAREVWNNGRGCSQWSGPNWSACRR